MRWPFVAGLVRDACERRHVDDALHVRISARGIVVEMDVEVVVGAALAVALAVVAAGTVAVDAAVAAVGTSDLQQEPFSHLAGSLRY